MSCWICITGWGCPATLSPARAPGAVLSASPFLCRQNPSESKPALPSVCLRAHVFDSLPTRHGLDLVPVGGLQPLECPCPGWGCGVREAGNGKPSDIPWGAPSLSSWGNDQYMLRKGRGTMVLEQITVLRALEKVYGLHYNSIWLVWVLAPICRCAN